MAKEIIKYEGTPAGSWMVTFSDMNTLLLTFFVLLFSMATIATDRFDEIFQTESGDGLGLLDQEGTTYSSSIVFEPLPFLDRSTRVSLLQAFGTDVDIINAAVGVPNGVQIDISDGLSGKITITLADRILFSPGETEIIGQNRELLEKLRLFIQKVVAVEPRRIVIEGHTDNRTPEEERFLISSDRAKAVLDVMLEDGVLPPALFTIVGYGDTKQIAPNTSDANRAANRRVRVILEPRSGEFNNEEMYQ